MGWGSKLRADSAAPSASLTPLYQHLVLVRHGSTASGTAPTLRIYPVVLHVSHNSKAGALQRACLWLWTCCPMLEAPKFKDRSGAPMWGKRGSNLVHDRIGAQTVPVGAPNPQNQVRESAEAVGEQVKPFHCPSLSIHRPRELGQRPVKEPVQRTV